MSESDRLGGPGTLRVAVDVGGTFTDAVCFDTRSGALVRSKAATTPGAVASGQIDAILRLGVDLDAIGELLNATTVVTNALLTRSGTPTAFVTTRGFRDSLETGRERRVGGGLHMYDLSQQAPPALAPRHLRFGLDERLSADGQVLRPLDDHEVRGVARRIAGLGIRCVAVCLLFAFRNGAHERRVREILCEEIPDCRVTLSCEIAPEVREYERGSTAFMNAYTERTFSDYLDGFAAALARRGCSPQMFVLQSNGGVLPSGAGGILPIHVVESGPAAGLIAARYVGERAGYRDLIGFDVGGTTAKAGLVQRGRIGTIAEYKVGGYYPIKAPSVDLVEIGCGGGSIAWIDEGGSLRIGPSSAGAVPGPACYGQGGERPTVTDANVLLGRIDANRSVAGRASLDVRLAEEAIRRHVAQPLGIDVVEAAAGILRIANTQMAGAIRLVSTERGRDPRDFQLVAYGGGGPLHAAEICVDLELAGVLVPDGPGTLSALGLLVADLKADAVRTWFSPLPAVDAAAMERAFVEMQAHTRARIDPSAARDARSTRMVDARYRGQRWEITIELPRGPLDESMWQAIKARFDAAHFQAYRFCDADAPVEIVNLRVETTAHLQHPDAAPRPVASRTPSPATTRRVLVGGRLQACACYERGVLAPGDVLEGPATIDADDSAAWVPAGFRCEVDAWSNLLIRPGTRKP